MTKSDAEKKVENIQEGKAWLEDVKVQCQSAKDQSHIHRALLMATQFIANSQLTCRDLDIESGEPDRIISSLREAFAIAVIHGLNLDQSQVDVERITANREGGKYTVAESNQYIQGLVELATDDIDGQNNLKNAIILVRNRLNFS